MAKKKISLAAAAGSASAADAFVSGAPDMQKPKRGRPRVDVGEETTRLNVEIGASQMIGLKRKALDEGMTLKELLADMIERELAQ